MKQFEEYKEISAEEVKDGLTICTDQILRNLPDFTEKFQSNASEALFYKPIDNTVWTCGFWTGEIWLAYEYCKQDCLKKAAELQCESFLERIRERIAVEHHDMGFLYSPSCVAAYKLTGNERAKKAALMAADNLLSRFRTKGDFIQCWGNPGEPPYYKLIVDCMMNLPLLYWAAEETGDNKYREAAIKHFRTTAKYALREDGSTLQAVYFNVDTGACSKVHNIQGYSDDSCWARGQSWVIYGAALSYKYTGLEECAEVFRKTAGYFLNHLPQDLVSYYDLYFTEGDELPRDSSATAITACGLLEMAKLLGPEEGAYYAAAARKLLKSLYDNYMVRDGKLSNGLLLHGTNTCNTPYNRMNQDKGRDECCSYGDYYYLEALTRLDRDWEIYW